MKKYLLSLMFILVGFLPLSVYAQSGGPIIDPTEPPRLSPALLPAFAAFDDNSGILGVTFRITIEEADILIYKDGGLVSDERVDNIVVGSTFYYPLFAFGSGEYAVYIKIGENTILVYEVTI